MNDDIKQDKSPRDRNNSMDDDDKGYRGKDGDKLGRKNPKYKKKQIQINNPKEKGKKESLKVFVNRQIERKKTVLKK